MQGVQAHSASLPVQIKNSPTTRGFSGHFTDLYQHSPGDIVHPGISPTFLSANTKSGVTMNRADLEQWKSVKEMGNLIRQFDETAVRDLKFAGRRGLIKDMVEEYVPLWKLVRYWPSIGEVRLTSKTYAGADAWLRLAAGGERSVQITLADASEQSFFNRIASASRRPYFTDQLKTYDRRTQQLQGAGRVLQSPAGLIRRYADAFVSAVARKQNDCSGTDILLVVYERSVLPRRLRTAVKHAVQAKLKQKLLHQRFGAAFVLLGDSILAP